MPDASFQSQSDLDEDSQSDNFEAPTISECREKYSSVKNTTPRYMPEIPSTSLTSEKESKR